MKFVLLPALVLLCTFPARAQELSSADADRFLDQLAAERAAIPGVEKNFREEKHMSLVARPIVTSGTIAFQPPGSFRRDVSGQNPSLTVSDGSTLWVYYPELSEAEKYNLNEPGPVRDSISAMVTSLNFQDLKKNFRYRIRRASDGWEITLDPKSGTLRKIFEKMTILLDNGRRVARLDLVSPGGDKTSTVFHDEKEKKFPPGYFSFSPPPNVSVSSPLGN